MRLSRVGKEWYTLEIATSPDAIDWEASFNDGESWAFSTVVGDDGFYRWLVAGPDADPIEAVAVLPMGRTKPLVRLRDQPEIVVRNPPYIFVK